MADRRLTEYVKFTINPGEKIYINAIRCHWPFGQGEASPFSLNPYPHRCVVRIQPPDEEIMDYKYEKYWEYKPENFGFTLRDADQSPTCYPGDLLDVEFPNWTKDGYSLFFAANADWGGASHPCEILRREGDAENWFIGGTDRGEIHNNVEEFDLNIYLRIQKPGGTIPVLPTYYELPKSPKTI